MQHEPLKINSNHIVMLSDDSNSDSADAKFIICDFGLNGNGVSLNRDTIEDWLNTLINKPVVGKVISLYNGKEDFSGHNAKVVESIDEEGNKVKSIEFDSQAFGSFYSVQLETIDDVEYITASAKIWKRFKKAYSVFKKRAESKKGLKTSWEINVSESHTEKIKGKNIKVIDQGEFIGHCLLGESVAPAYKSSGVINVASVEQDYELANALSQDLLTLSEESQVEKPNDEDNNINLNSNEEGGSKTVENQDPNVSSLTENDVYRKVRKAINSASSDKYYYMAMIYPYEYRVIAYDWSREKDSDFIEFSYTVNSDDTVSITGQKEVEMVFQPKAAIESQVSDLQTKLDEAEKQIAEAGKLLTDATKQKEEFETQISELIPFKEKVEELERAEQERVLAEKKDELKTFALEDELISAEELETDESLASIFAELTIENYEISQGKIEIIKGRKAIAKFRENKELSTQQNNNGEQQTEVSETQVSQKPKVDLNNGDGDTILVSATDLVKNVFLKK